MNKSKGKLNVNTSLIETNDRSSNKSVQAHSEINEDSIAKLKKWRQEQKQFDMRMKQRTEEYEEKLKRLKQEEAENEEKLKKERS